LAFPLVGLTLLASFVAWRERRVSLLGAFALGSLAGWGVTNGWWAWEMWWRFGNPFFPFLNDLFRSPFLASGFTGDTRWLASRPLEWLLLPVDAALGRHRRLQEVPFRDPRLLLVLLALGGWLVRHRLPLRKVLRRGMPGRGLVAYWLGTYGAWLAVFQYYRYAAVLEFLAPVVVLALLEDLWPRRAVLVAPALAAVLFVATSVRPWGRAGEWEQSWFNPRLPALAGESRQLILLPSPGTSFVVPFFPRDASFIGLWHGGSYGPAMIRAVEARIERHEGPLVMLARSPGEHREAMHALGLAIEEPCQEARFGHARRFQMCRLRRSSSSLRRPGT
jgi:hypothetical protein